MCWDYLANLIDIGTHNAAALHVPTAQPYTFKAALTFAATCGDYPITSFEYHANYISQQIDDTVGVMRENINKVSQRGDHLDALQDKTDNLAVSAQGFRRGANRVRKQMWWKDMKMRMCLIVGIIILLIVIIVPSGNFWPSKEEA